MIEKENTVSSDLIYTGKTVSLRVDTVEVPNKGYQKREIVEHNGVVAVIAITEDNKIILVKQYRKSIEDVVLEIPGGKLELNENPRECAIREFRKKTGYDAESFKLIHKFYPSVGFSNQMIFIYLAKKLEKLEDKQEEQQIEIKEIDIAKEFIETMLHNAKVNADVIATQEDNLIKINIKGKEATCLIGRRGETLDAVQFLTGLALNKINKDSHCRVLVDIENYREKREQSLIRYANKVAREVAKTKRTKKLDYMNPYERRIIHSALQNDKYVSTYSEGTDPYRRLVIEYKR